MPIPDIFSLDTLFISLLIGYLLGSIPVASLVSRRRQLDIFSIGTGQSGATNVFRNVGHKSGALVIAGDAAKGGLAVIAASRLGLEGGWLLLPAGAAIAGHWRSIFTGFRGGDGLAPLVGITIALLPMYGLIAAFMGGTTALGLHRMAHPTLWGGSLSYGFLLGRSLYNGADTVLTLGIVMLALMVLAHTVIGHRHRREATASDTPDEDVS